MKQHIFSKAFMCLTFLVTVSISMAAKDLSHYAMLLETDPEKALIEVGKLWQNKPVEVGSLAEGVLMIRALLKNKRTEQAQTLVNQFNQLENLSLNHQGLLMDPKLKLARLTQNKEQLEDLIQQSHTLLAELKKQGKNVETKKVISNLHHAIGLYYYENGNFSEAQSQLQLALNKTTGSGFLRAYMTETGQEVLSVETKSRINQVSVSWDGRYLAACFGQTVVLYWFNPFILKYQSIFSATSDNHEINSCMISRDGSRLVASGIKYDSTSTEKPINNINTNISDTGTVRTTGCAYSYHVSGQNVTTQDPCNLTTGSMRVAVADSGDYWAAALHSGGCALFQSSQPSQALWQETLTKPGLELAYGLAITKTLEGHVYVACGANLNTHIAANGGYLYVLKSLKTNGQQKSTIIFEAETERGINPGVCLDLNAHYITAFDGKPVGQTPVESLGSFYLYDIQSNTKIWQYPTAKMNWGMTINPGGEVVFGGSDDGSVYYWT